MANYKLLAGGWLLSAGGSQLVRISNEAAGSKPKAASRQQALFLLLGYRFASPSHLVGTSVSFGTVSTSRATRTALPQ